MPTSHSRSVRPLGVPQGHEWRQVRRQGCVGRSGGERLSLRQHDIHRHEPLLEQPEEDLAGHQGRERQLAVVNPRAEPRSWVRTASAKSRWNSSRPASVVV